MTTSLTLVDNLLNFIEEKRGSYNSSNRLKLGINGFGRIGRMVFRASQRNVNLSDIQIVAINDPFVPPDYMLYQLKYDSTHGKFQANATLSKDNNCLIVNNNRIRIFQERNPSKIDWDSVGANYVLECTGVFKEKDTASKHLENTSNVKRVIISAPSKTVNNFVLSCNEDKINLKDDILLSNASCTTNCLAPITNLLNQTYGIKQALMTTIHSVTSTQNSVDGVSKKNFRGGRGGFSNIIPTTTGAAKAVGKVLPELNGLINGMAFRVPTPNVSVVDLTVDLKQKVTYDELCQMVKNTVNNNKRYQGILEYTEDELVSQDLIGNPHSCIFDSKAGIQLSDTFFKIICWYDNEWGYSNRMIDLARFVATRDGLL